MYDEILSDSVKKRDAWYDAQSSTIEIENNSTVQDQLDIIASSITALSDFTKKSN